ncbi:MAG: hypothetical protein ACO24A_03550 [Burkholderiaceae bacterium]
MATVTASKVAAAVTVEYNGTLSVGMGANTAAPAAPPVVGALVAAAGLALLVVDETGECVAVSSAGDAVCP